MNDQFEILTETVLEGKPSDRPWEGCINSVNYRIQRGTKVRLPLFVAEHIARTEQERKNAERMAERLSALNSRVKI